MSWFKRKTDLAREYPFPVFQPTSVHINGGDEKTMCGRDLDQLCRDEPNGALVCLVTSVSGAQGDPHSVFDAIAKRATCVECQQVYWGSRLRTTQVVVRPVN